jgi:phospholipase C
MTNHGSKPALPLSAVLAALALAACRGLGPSVTPPATASNAAVGADLSTPIRHVIVIVQENRTPDYLFQGIPGADIAKYGTDSRGDRVKLQPISLQTQWDLKHAHTSFLQDFNDGKMNGFDAGLPEHKYLRPFGYAPESEVAPYHEMAKQYVFADRMFQSNQGPSFPAHLYIVSGTAGDASTAPYRVATNPHDGDTGRPAPGGCDAKPSVYVATIDPRNGSAGPKPFPCFDRPVLANLLEAKHVSWRYYQPHRGAGRWEAMDAYRNVRYTHRYDNVVWPSQRILDDVKVGRLAGVSWVIPAGAWSDHAGRLGSTKGPSWVAAIVNAVGESRYWRSTAIFITWDDWGGWYDHVPPPIENHYELGFRVPLVVVSPYAKRGYVSKTRHEFASLLVFTEETFGIARGSLGTTDRRADDLMDCFDFSQKPRAFAHIKAPPFHPDANDGYGPGDEDI